MRVSNTPTFSDYYNKKESFIEQATKQQEASEQKMLSSMYHASNSTSNVTSNTTSATTSSSTTRNEDQWIEDMLGRMSENDQNAYRSIKEFREKQTREKTKKKKFSSPVKFTSSAMLQQLAATKTTGGVHSVINTARVAIRATKNSSSSTIEIQATVRKLKRVIRFAEKKLTALHREEQLREQKEMAKIVENRREEIKAAKEEKRKKKIRNAYERCNTIDSEDMMRNAKLEHYDSIYSEQTTASAPSSIPSVASIETSMSVITSATESAVQSSELIAAAANFSDSSIDIVI